MQTPIAQVIALTLFGNGALQGQQVDQNYFPSNSTFAFCEYVKFVDASHDTDQSKETSYADNPLEWINRLISSNVQTLRLIYTSSEQDELSDRMTAGFVGGGGRWLIEAITPKGSDYWEASWEVGDENHPNDLIWQVTYGRIAKSEQSVQIDSRKLSEVKSDLTATLNEIINFADKHKLNEFSKSFRHGLKVLESNNPLEEVFHKDIAPDGLLNTEASQLLAASQAAWVFGGMGSWNDLGFEGSEQEYYVELSESLYQLLNEAYFVAVNTTVNY
jgi:hypothetical protein